VVAEFVKNTALMTKKATIGKQVVQAGTSANILSMYRSMNAGFPFHARW
jgi:hypothetical protein